MANELVTFNEANIFRVLNFQGRAALDLSYTINRGNTRRFNALPPARQATIPTSVALRDTPTTHTMTLRGEGAGDSTGDLSFVKGDYRHEDWVYLETPVGTFRWAGDYPQPSTIKSDECLMLHLSAGANLIGRFKASKVLAHKVTDKPWRFFAVLTWTDFFGASIKENALDRRVGGNRIVYLRELTDHTDLLKGSMDAFFDMFPPVSPETFVEPDVDPQWLTESVVGLLRTIKAGDPIHPILADALEDAGCDNYDILNHFRGEAGHGEHCWATRPFYRALGWLTDPVEAAAEAAATA